MWTFVVLGFLNRKNLLLKFNSTTLIMKSKAV